METWYQNKDTIHVHLPITFFKFVCRPLRFQRITTTILVCNSNFSVLLQNQKQNRWSTNRNVYKKGQKITVRTVYLLQWGTKIQYSCCHKKERRATQGKRPCGHSKGEKRIKRGLWEGKRRKLSFWVFIAALADWGRVSSTLKAWQFYREISASGSQTYECFVIISFLFTGNVIVRN